MERKYTKEERNRYYKHALLSLYKHPKACIQWCLWPKWPEHSFDHKKYFPEVYLFSPRGWDGNSVLVDYNDSDSYRVNKVILLLCIEMTND